MTRKDELITEATLQKHLAKWTKKADGLPPVAVGSFKKTRGGNIGIEVIVPTTKKYTENSKELGKLHPLAQNSKLPRWNEESGYRKPIRAVIRMGDPTTVTTTIVVPEKELAAILGTIDPLTDRTPEIRKIGVTVPRNYSNTIKSNQQFMCVAPSSIKRLERLVHPPREYWPYERDEELKYIKEIKKRKISKFNLPTTKSQFLSIYKKFKKLKVGQVIQVNNSYLVLEQRYKGVQYLYVTPDFLNNSGTLNHLFMSDYWRIGDVFDETHEISETELHEMFYFFMLDHADHDHFDSIDDDDYKNYHKLTESFGYQESTW